MKIMLANKPCIAYNNSCSIPLAGVMELVDVADSKSADGDIVWVRVPPPAPSSETLDTSAFEASSVFPFLQQEASISLCFFTVLSAVLSTILFQTLVLMPGSMITTLLIFDAEVFFDDVSRCA